MQNLPILIAIAVFTAMGISAIAKPAYVTDQFGILKLTPACRSKVRAVHGDFGIFMGFALLVALPQEELRDVIVFALTAALGGMAAGRLVSAAIDRAIDRAPVGYLVLEVGVRAVAACRNCNLCGLPAFPRTHARRHLLWAVPRARDCSGGWASSVQSADPPGHDLSPPSPHRTLSPTRSPPQLHQPKGNP